MSTRARPKRLELLESRLLFAAATFQQGVGGYVGAVDTTVRLDFPDTSFGDSPLIVTSLDDADLVTGNQPDEGLIRFDGVFSASAGQIPAGATVTSATLTVVTGTNTGDSSTALSSLYRMLAPWGGASTWNTLTNGISTDGIEAAAAADGSVKPSTLGGAVSFDVTATVQGWANNPSTNQGWATISTGTNTWQWNSSEATTASRRPMLSITYTNPSGENQPPTVSAGNDASVTLPNTIALDGTVSDDGLPAPASLTTAWSRFSGPGTVTFADASAVDTTASFSAPGTYVLRLSASDGSLGASDDVTILVNPAGQTNQPPTVNAGNDATITLPALASLDGTVTDDGLPAPANLTMLWTRVSGPGTVTFGNASAVDTTASFSVAGTYVLRLSASDGELSNSDDVTISVNPVQPPPTTTHLLDNLDLSTDTGEKPQSKVWKFNATWWGVFANNSGTFVWQLVNSQTWQSVLKLSSSTNAQADVKPIGAGDVVHAMLYEGTSSQLASIEYVNGAYQLWSQRPTLTTVTFGTGVETASMDVDTSGRMWVAYEAGNTINVRYSDGNYSSFSSPVALATGIASDDIAATVAMPDGSEGVMWSNQNTKRFGFRKHAAGAAPTTWGSSEVPAPNAALSAGHGMADDHINLKASSNGTVYAIVKTGYDTSGTTQIGLLVRRPTGAWDSSLYRVSTSGTRGIVELNESRNLLMAVYTAATGFHNIVYRTSSLTGSIAFSSEHTLLSGLLNNAQSTKQTVDTDVVVVAGNTNERMNGVQFVWSSSPPSPAVMNGATMMAGTAPRHPLFADDLLDGSWPIPV